MRLVQDRVILVTFGRQSKCLFMLLSDYQSWRKTIDKNEYVLITHTDMDAADLEFMNRSNAIIDRLEREVDEVEQRLVDRMKQRKRA
jgi:hypothetical protein